MASFGLRCFQLFFQYLFIINSLLLLSPPPVLSQLESAHKRFEYKYSFKPPYLAQKDGTVPFWEHSGNAIASEENLRVTPSLRSQKGAMWSKLQTNFDQWEVELVFRVTGRGRIGADGLAFWFTETKGVDGPVFGSSDMWKGLGIFFDSFDNDNKHNNPYILAMVNDGTKQFDHQNDASTQQLAGCLRDFRNKPFPVRAKISYFKNVLMVMFNNGMSNNEGDFEMCMRVENVYLPPRGFFGVSAATGGLADDHDVQKFMTWSLQSGDPNIPLPISTDDQQKFEKEFQQYQQELDKKKEEYIKEHPDHQPKEKDEEDWFEEEQIRELRQIFQGQSELRGIVHGLSRKLDEIVGRQETTISLVSSLQVQGLAQGQGQQPGHQQFQGGAPPVAQVPQIAAQSTIQRHEVENILQATRELVQSTRDVKNLLQSIKLNQDQGGGGGGGQPSSYGAFDFANSFNEIKEGINNVKRDVSVVSQRVHSQPQGQPQVSGSGSIGCNCVTTSSLFQVLGLFCVLQIITLFAYSYYKNSKENQSKKFY